MRKLHVVILGVALVGATAVVLSWPKDQPTPPAAPQKSAAPTPMTYEAYQQRLAALLAPVSREEFYSAAGAQRLHDALLAMAQLPPEAQAPHLLLVLATDKVMAGKIDEVKVILEELGKQEWLTEGLKKYIE